MVPGGAAATASEEGGKNALHVRVDIGSMEVSAPAFSRSSVLLKPQF